MRKLYIFITFLLLFVPLVFSSCEKEENESTFLEAHSEKMWNLVERDGDSVSSDEHIGFSNNKSESLFYQVYIYNSDDYDCFTYKEGENITRPECGKYNDDGSLINGDEGVVIYSIIENKKNTLVLDKYYIDCSCESMIRETIRSTYSVDGDFLYENRGTGFDSNRTFSLSTKSRNEFCN